MKKTIFITGATDGIGLETAKMLAEEGHYLLLHGRNQAKLEKVTAEIAAISAAGKPESYLADMSKLAEVATLADAVMKKHSRLDVLINNAGVFHVGEVITSDGLETRFSVNTIAPYLLTKRLLPVFAGTSRVVNVSSAAQAPVNLQALAGQGRLDDGMAYAQSKLALTMWSRDMAQTLGADGPSIIAINPRSFLGSKMVKQAYGMAGGDLRIGADILCRAALSDEFASASGKYFDNDIGSFSEPHPDALDEGKNKQLVAVLEKILAEKGCYQT